MGVFTEDYIKVIEEMINKNKNYYESNKDLFDEAFYKATTPADAVLAILAPFLGYEFYEIRNKSFEDMSDDEVKCYCGVICTIMAPEKLCDEN